MSNKKTVGTFTARKQKHYERVARLQYGPDTVNESIKRWNSYTKERQEAILAEGGEVYQDIVNALNRGLSPQSAEVQDILRRWHDNLRNFYEPTLEILRGLGEAYKTEPGFIAFFEKLHSELPEYLSAGITQYVDDLESAEIAAMLAEDDLKVSRSRLSFGSGE